MPNLLRAFVKTLSSYSLGFEDDMLSVVPFPVLTDDTLFLIEHSIQWSFRKRCRDCKTRQVNTCFEDEFQRFVKHTFSIAIDTEDKATLHSDAMIVKHFDAPEIVVWLLPRLSHRLQSIRIL